MKENIKKKGIIFSTAYYPFIGGAEIAVKEITERQTHIEWDLITARINRKLPKSEKIGAVTVYRCGLGLGWVDKFTLPIFGLASALKRHKTQKYNFAWSMMASQASVAAALFKACARRVKLVLTLQEGDDESHLRRYVWNIKSLYTVLIRPWHSLVFWQANYCTVISEHLRSRAVAMGLKVPIVLIPNGVDYSVFDGVRERPVFSENEVNIVTTSRLVLKNAVDDVIRAMPFLPREFTLTVAGSGPLLGELKRLAKYLHVEDRVRFVGSITHKDTSKLLSVADVFVRPSLSEGLGNSFLEAMAQKVPIVGTRVGGIPDFLVDNQTGLFCKTSNPESIAETILRLRNDSVLRERVVQNAYELVRNKYDWTKITKSMNEAFVVPEAPCSIVIAAGIFPPDPGGPALHAKKYFYELNRLGVDTRVIALSWFRRFPFGVRHLVYFIRLSLMSFGADVVYAMDPLGAGVPAKYACFLSRAKLLVRSGGDVVWERHAEQGGGESMLEFYDKGKYHNDSRFKYCKSVIESASILVVPSELLALLYRDYFGADERNIALIPNPLPAVTASSISGDNSILFASRLVAYKNLDFVLRSFAAINNKIATSKLVILGDGPEKDRLKKAAVRYGIANRVEFAGVVSQEEVQERARKCSLAIAAAFTEFNPNYILLCLALKKPFLVSRENGFPFRIPEIMLFDPKNRDEFETKLVYLMTEEGSMEARKKLEEIGFEMTWDDVIGAHIKILEELCAS